MLSTKSILSGSYVVPAIATAVAGGSALDIVVYGGYNHLTWLTSGTLTVTGAPLTAEVLVVGGGGAGGNGLGAGAAGGGVLHHSSYEIAVGGPYTITIGAGGARNDTANAVGATGSNTVFGSVTVRGGGGGEGQNGAHGLSAGDMANSGGVHYGAAASTVLTPTGQTVYSGWDTTGYHKKGGYNPNHAGGTTDWGSGGGAGAGGDSPIAGLTGGVGRDAGNGGVGIQHANLSATGASHYWGGGGGGGAHVSGRGGTGGLGGGGGGQTGDSTSNYWGSGGGSALNAGVDAGGGAYNTYAGNGGANTGGGGGGGCNDAASVPVGSGGAGGSGIVIIKWE